MSKATAEMSDADQVYSATIDTPELREQCCNKIFRNCTVTSIQSFQAKDPFNDVTLYGYLYKGRNPEFINSFCITSINQDAIKYPVLIHGHPPISTPSFESLQELQQKGEGNTQDNALLKSAASEAFRSRQAPSFVLFSNIFNGTTITFFKYTDDFNITRISAYQFAESPVMQSNDPAFLLARDTLLGGKKPHLTSLPPPLQALGKDSIQSVTLEMFGAWCPGYVTYKENISFFPIFITTRNGQIYPCFGRTGRTYDPETQQIKYYTEPEKDAFTNWVDLYTKCSELQVQDALVNNAYQFQKNITKPEYWPGNFLVEGYRLYLLNNSKVATMDRNSIIDVKPKETRATHTIIMPKGLQLRVLEFAQDQKSKGLEITPESMQKCLGLGKFQWLSLQDTILSIASKHIPSAAFGEAGPRMVVLVGIPGSGKSTISNLLAQAGWARINQDEMKSRSKCEVVAKKMLSLGKSVVIDRCNFDIYQRQVWVNIAKQSKVSSVDAIYLNIPVEVCCERVLKRENHPTVEYGTGREVVAKFHARICPPSLIEGFSSVNELTSSDLENAKQLLQDRLNIDLTVQENNF